MAQEEYAIVNWKSNVEIVQTISSLLGSIDPKSLGYDESSKSHFTYAEYINLDNPKHIELVNAAIQHELQSSSSIEQSKEDVILIARFIVAFYSQTKHLREEKTFSISAASRIIMRRGWTFHPHGKTYGTRQSLWNISFGIVLSWQRTPR